MAQHEMARSRGPARAFRLLVGAVRALPYPRDLFQGRSGGACCGDQGEPETGDGALDWRLYRAAGPGAGLSEVRRPGLEKHRLRAEPPALMHRAALDTVSYGVE